jgi:RNA polymerase sigma-70 factor (ECF subfamily)
MALKDAARMSELFTRHGPAVYRRSLRLLGNHADAEEATQEVFIRAFRAADAFQGQSQVTTWLYRITTNYCLNQLRDRRRRRELFAEQVAPAPPGGPPSPGDVVLLRRLLSEADEEQARAAIYVHLDGMTHEEVADLLGVSRRTVGNLLARFHEWASHRLKGPASAPQVEPAGDRRVRSRP